MIAGLLNLNATDIDALGARARDAGTPTVVLLEQLIREPGANRGMAI